MAIENGSNVSVHYTGKLEDGSVFDSSEGRDPLQFRVGTGQLIAGFEAAVMGKDVGDKVTAEIEPADGYGERREEMVQDVPREALQGAEVELGQMLAFQGPEGQQFQGTVMGLTDEVVKMDFNHFLAGKALTFDIEIVAVE